MGRLAEYLKKAHDLGASDVFIVAGAPASAKIDDR